MEGLQLAGSLCQLCKVRKDSMTKVKIDQPC